jgi:hypothetical protein
MAPHLYPTHLPICSKAPLLHCSWLYASDQDMSLWHKILAQAQRVSCAIRNDRLVWMFIDIEMTGREKISCHLHTLCLKKAPQRHFRSTILILKLQRIAYWVWSNVAALHAWIHKAEAFSIFSLSIVRGSSLISTWPIGPIPTSTQSTLYTACRLPEARIRWLHSEVGVSPCDLFSSKRRIKLLLVTDRPISRCFDHKRWQVIALGWRLVVI